MAIKCAFTQDLTAFKKIDVPMFEYKISWFSENYKIPEHIYFNRVYYKYDNNLKGLVAFRILAYSVYEKHDKNDRSLIFLVQLPNKSPQWIRDFITPETMVYDSVESYVSSSGTNTTDLGWRDLWRCVLMKPVHRDTFFFTEKFYSIKNGAVVESDGAYVRTMVFVEEGCLVCISKNNLNGYKGEGNIYFTQADASRDLLDGLIVTDFADPATIDITIEVLPTAPKVMQIRIIE